MSTPPLRRSARPPPVSLPDLPSHLSPPATVGTIHRGRLGRCRLCCNRARRRSRGATILRALRAAAGRLRPVGGVSAARAWCCQAAQHGGAASTAPLGPDLGLLGPIWIGAGRHVRCAARFADGVGVAHAGVQRQWQPACCSVVAGFTDPVWVRPDPIGTGVLLRGVTDSGGSPSRSVAVPLTPIQATSRLCLADLGTLASV